MSRPPADLIRAGATDIFAGLFPAPSLSLLPRADLRPPLNTWLAYGIAATFITSAVTATIVSLRSSLPFAIAGPDPITVAVTATLVGALMVRIYGPRPAG